MLPGSPKIYAVRYEPFAEGDGATLALGEVLMYLRVTISAP